MASRFRNLEFEEESADADPSLGPAAPAHDALARLQRAHEANRWGEFEQALRLYTRCLQADRQVIPAWVGQVQMLVQLGEYREARVWSDKALELFRANGELLAAKSQACTRLGDRRAAYAFSDAAMQAPGSSPWRWQVRGELLLAAGQPHADECFQRALTEPTADWFDRVVAARIYFFHHRATNAMDYLKQALELQPTHGYIWFERGNCERALGLAAAATRSYERCLELRAGYPPAVQALDALSAASPLAWVRGLLRRWTRR